MNDDKRTTLKIKILSDIGNYIITYKLSSKTEVMSLEQTVFIKKDDLSQQIRSSISRDNFEDPYITQASQLKIANSNERIAKYILDKLNIKNGDLSNIDEIKILSDIQEVHESDWENSIDTSRIIPTIRIIYSTKRKVEEKNNINLLVAMSHAHSYKCDISEDINNEVNKLVENIIYPNPTKAKLNRILILKHTTKKEFQKLPFKKYNAIHLVSHGNSGNVEFEEENNHEETDNICMLDFLKYIKKNVPYLLTFYSFCESAGSMNSDQNLCLTTIKNGISKNSIGYYNGAKSKKSMDFSSRFYEAIFTSKYKTVSEIYFHTLKEYLSAPNNSDNIPKLYTTNNNE